MINFGLKWTQIKGPYSVNSETVYLIFLSYLELKMLSIISLTFTDRFLTNRLFGTLKMNVCCQHLPVENLIVG